MTVPFLSCVALRFFRSPSKKKAKKHTQLQKQLQEQTTEITVGFPFFCCLMLSCWVSVFFCVAPAKQSFTQNLEEDLFFRSRSCSGRKGRFVLTMDGGGGGDIFCDSDVCIHIYFVSICYIYNYISKLSCIFQNGF